MPAAYPRRSCRGKAGHLPRQTVHGERGNRAESDRYRSSALSAVGFGKGRSLCSSPRAGKPLTWRREAASCAVGYWKNRRTPVNASASWPEAEQARNRVLEIQTKLHRWAVEDRSKCFDDLFNLVAELMNLGDGVLSPPIRAEAVGARLEVRLEDRFEHQLECCLDHSVPSGWDAEPALLRCARFRNQPLAYGQRPETAGLQINPHLGEKGLLAAFRLHRVGRLSVHSGRTSTLVAAHPTPGYTQKRRVTHQVEQVVRRCRPSKRRSPASERSGNCSTTS